MSMLKVEGLNVYYGSIHAIKGVSFEVNQGEIVTMIGANGAGKSTTMNTVAGLLKPKSGSIIFEDHDVTTTPANKVVSHGLAPERAPAPDFRHALRRRTADARHGPRADEQAEAADA